jgi:hypothetical protein
MRKLSRTLRTTIVLVSVVILALIVPSMLFNVSAMNGGSSASDYYAGYDVCAAGVCNVFTFPFPTFSLVQGSFVVPAVGPCPASGLQFVNYEIKDGGYDGAGIQFGCDTFPFYFAEVFKAASTVGLGSSYPVDPGDHISVKITYSMSTSSFKVVMHDSTHIWTYNTGTYTDSSNFPNEAEFVLARTGTTSASPIPQFSTLKTSGDYVTITSGATSLKGSVGHWFASTSSQSLYATVYEFSMSDSDTGHTLAAPSAVTSTSTGFYIKWLAST